MTKDYKKIIDENLKNYMKVLETESLHPIILDSISYSLLSESKRIRPIFLIKTYEAFNNNINNLNEIIPFACAVEMIHTYSIIHDDLPAIDNDDFRRGKLSNHKVFGENLAILAGDALLNLAYETMFDFCSKNNNIKYILAAKEIASSVGIKGMINGQVLDIISQGKKIHEKTLLFIHKNKTAKLIKSSILTGAILSNIKEKDIDNIKNLGYLVGIAFQIKNDLDDLSDINKTSDKIKNLLNSDIRNNKVTYVTMHGVSKAKEDMKNYIKEAIDIINKINVDLDSIKQFILQIFTMKN